MKALIFDLHAPRGWHFGDIARPQLTARQALVNVASIDRQHV